ncbi:MAG: D-alanine--D-alanine ligase [Deltaproteobacteria bacterium]|nr:D-alanine--D-alanine ligase [Deltaproteobacteria bacterium]
MRIGVLMGGMSTEREISLKSGKAVYNALIQKYYNAVAIDVGRDVFSKITKQRIDIAFIALHGKYGEDGAIQGLLEIMGIPYTGSGILASAISINKVLAKRLFMLNKIPTPAFKVVKKGDVINNAMFEGLGLPSIVKPNSQGSTIGVSVVSNKKNFPSAIKKALKYNDTALIEKFIKGRELTVGILSGRALPIVEIRPKNGMYDFKAKYTKGMTDYVVPAPISKTLEKMVADIAFSAFNTLECSSAARVDIMLDNKNRPYVLEVNTIPGMTELSLLPKAAKYAGINFPDMVEEILLSAYCK